MFTSRKAKALGLIIVTAILLAVTFFSIALGAKSIPLSTVWRILLLQDDSTEAVIVYDIRIPRTILGILVGAALGVAGTVSQSLTRNSLADPGLLGINLGASTAVVISISWFGITYATGYIWFAFAGASCAIFLVFLISAYHQENQQPERLLLAGVALSAVLSAVVSAVLLIDPGVFQQFRFWVIGSLTGREMATIIDLFPFIALGMLVALSLARSLNAFNLGIDTGRSLGVSFRITIIMAIVSVVLLCGAATAAAGPIAFIGLAVPHITRLCVGHDQRWVIPYSMLIAAILLLTADIFGRLLAAPAEIEVGVVVAFLGAPILIMLCRKSNEKQT